MYMNDFMEGAKSEFSVFASQKRKISDQRKEAPTSHLVFCAYLEKKSRRALIQVKKRIKKEVQGRKVRMDFRVARFGSNALSDVARGKGVAET